MEQEDLHPFRAQRMRLLLKRAAGELTATSAKAWFCDHVNHPSGICTHPDTRLESAEQYATISAVIMDLSESRLLLSDGFPCESPFRELDYLEFLDKPTRIVQPKG